jgi:hypothetical protein
VSRVCARILRPGQRVADDFALQVVYIGLTVIYGARKSLLAKAILADFLSLISALMM